MNKGLLIDIKVIVMLLRNSDLLNKNNIKLNNINNINNFQQKGGYNKLRIEHNNNDYIFEESEIDKNHYILNSKNNDECVIVIISKEDKIAEIHSIGNYKSCLYNTNENVGSELLKITIKMLKKYKKKV